MTVARFPKSIFVLAASMLVIATVLLSFVRTPATAAASSPPKKRKLSREEEENRRGRSRASKDLSRSSSILVLNQAILASPTSHSGAAAGSGSVGTSYGTAIGAQG